MTKPERHAAATLTPVAESDFHELRELAETIWRQHYEGIISSAQIEYMLASRFNTEALREYLNPTNKWLDLLRVSAKMVGYCGYELAGHGSDDGVPALKLGQLYIVDSHRGLGLGKAMLSHVEARAKDHGLKRIFLQVNKRNTDSIEFYKAAGFTVSREAVFDIGNGFVMDDYVLEKGVSGK